MLIRIVKLTFKHENIYKFEQIFKETKQHIQDFEGCISLELLQDKTKPNIFFTYSQWASEEHLNNYRNSDFFTTIWSNARELFESQPEAWSLHKKRLKD